MPRAIFRLKRKQVKNRFEIRLKNERAAHAVNDLFTSVNMSRKLPSKLLIATYALLTKKKPNGEVLWAKLDNGHFLSAKIAVPCV